LRRRARLAGVAAGAETVGNVLDTLIGVAITLLDQRPIVLLAAALAMIAVSWSMLWRWTRTVVTIAHEGGHALVAVLAGRGLTGIRLHADTSGLTVSTGARNGPGLVFTFLGGYPAPSLLGLGGAVLVATDRAALMLWLAIGLLVATLVHVRNFYGVFSVLATGALIGAVAWWGEPRLQDGFAAALCWFLLFGGLRAVRELQHGLRRGYRGASDADMLARLTGVPGGMWAALFWFLAGGAAITAAWVLLFT
jgi:peptidase M50B-like protein